MHAKEWAKHVGIVLRLCMVCTFALSSVSSPARADVIPDFSGVLTDPFKLGRASDNILQSVERMQLMLNKVGELEATTNADLAARIGEVKVIIDKVIDAADRDLVTLKQIIAQAEADIASLENTIYHDVERILDRVQCVAQNMATIQLQQAVASAADALNQADPSIKLLGFKIIDLRTSKVQITDPDLAYTSIRDGYLKRLATLGPTDSAYTILSTYANIERLAESASCAYNDPTVVAIFLREEFNYQRLAQPWKTVNVLMNH